MIVSDASEQAIRLEKGDSSAPRAMVPAERLAGLTDFWASWGFKPWAQNALAGVARKQRVVPDPVLGRAGEYVVWDYIVWSPGTEQEREELWRTLNPLPGVSRQRFLFLLEKPWPKGRTRAFFLGARGGVEFHAYWPEPLGRPDEPVESLIEPRDLTSLIRLGLRLTARAEENGKNPAAAAVKRP